MQVVDVDVDVDVGTSVDLHLANNLEGSFSGIAVRLSSPVFSLSKLCIDFVELLSVMFNLKRSCSNIYKSSEEISVTYCICS